MIFHFILPALCFSRASVLLPFCLLIGAITHFDNDNKRQHKLIQDDFKDKFKLMFVVSACREPLDEGQTLARQ